jgi:hypothetical protein
MAAVMKRLAAATSRLALAAERSRPAAGSAPRTLRWYICSRSCAAACGGVRVLLQPG